MDSLNATMAALPVDDNRGPGILALAWIEAIIALILVGGRFYCRGLVLHSIGRDDWTILCGFILSLASTACITVQVALGLGRHAVYLQPQQTHAVLKFMTVNEPFITFSSCLAKISICFLLLRIMQGKNTDSTRRIRIFIWILVASLLLVTLVCLIINFSACTPVWKLWEGPHGDPSCLDPRVHLYVSVTQSAYSSCTDFILAILPYFVIRNVQMDPKLKKGLICLLSLSFFAAAAAIVKTIHLGNMMSEDLTWDLSYLTPWIPTEQYTIIVAACIPTLKPLFRNYSMCVRRHRNSRQSHGPFSVNAPAIPRTPANPRLSFDEITLKYLSLDEITLQDPSLTPTHSRDRDTEQKMVV